MTADAMQRRAFGSIWLFPSPALTSLFAAYPSGIVHWPLPYSAKPAGFCIARRAMISMASSQPIGSSLPFLRRSGLVRRSLP
ncbi:hypothetical protein BE08_08885 [Sorangium cellulosum]|uniref:Uncharacterized protein n=1 Tax=Sorangium cellulosum TaxID=56 RepID=A0A150P546_SORCE|nr:hypothetical protein BE08_08885 [Sorangium cellulosum]